MTLVRIGNDHEYLIMTPEGEVSLGPEFVTVELGLEGLSASRRVFHHYATGFSDLAAFFQRLASDWRGWEGPREWESVEGDMRIEARHAHSHVHLHVTLRHDRPGWGNNGWVATGDLTVDPGEQLTKIAEDTRGMSERT